MNESALLDEFVPAFRRRRRVGRRAPARTAPPAAAPLVLAAAVVVGALTVGPALRRAPHPGPRAAAPLRGRPQQRRGRAAAGDRPDAPEGRAVEGSRRLLLRRPSGARGRACRTRRAGRRYCSAPVRLDVRPPRRLRHGHSAQRQARAADVAPLPRPDRRHRLPRPRPPAAPACARSCCATPAATSSRGCGSGSAERRENRFVQRAVRRDGLRARPQGARRRRSLARPPASSTTTATAA